MMKKHFLLALLLVLPGVLSGQSIFEKYQNNKEVTAISISPKMFQLFIRFYPKWYWATNHARRAANRDRDGLAEMPSDVVHVVHSLAIASDRSASAGL